LRFDFVPRLQDAIRTALADVRDGEVVLLLGAQGMNEAAAIAEGVLSERDATHGPPAAAEESEARPSSAGPA
jgi:hypothetical protein